MTLSELEEMWKTDAPLNERDEMVAVEALRVPPLHAKYLGIWMQVKKQTRQAESELAFLRGRKRRWYLGTMPEEELKELKWIPYLKNDVLKSNVDTFIAEDGDIIRKIDKVEYLRTMVGALESILKSIGNRGWDIKNAIAMIRFTGGE